MKTQMLSILSGIALAISMGSVQAQEPPDGPQDPQDLQEMPSILEGVSYEEILAMAQPEMETVIGSARRAGCGGPCCYRRGNKKH